MHTCKWMSLTDCERQSFMKSFFLLRFALAKQTTTRNIYKNIYLFSRRTIVWSRSNQERYENRSSMRPGLFGVSRRWPRKRTRGKLAWTTEFFQSSVQFVGLIWPLNSYAEIWIRLHAYAISSHNCLTEYATSALFGMACWFIVERK